MQMKSLDDVSAEKKPVGLNYWMDSVMQEWVQASGDFAPGHIHALRVALRRCRSIADGLVVLDPDPAWKQMRADGIKLFRQLGALRDTQVMMDWVRRLVPETGESFILMGRHLSERESRAKKNAEKALQNFRIKKWASWNRILSERMEMVPPDSLVFRHIALERWSEMRALHHQALRNRSHAGYHRLRIGLKKFRYTIENFLPLLYSLWGADLKRLQDLLGEMHDLQVLWQMALAIKAVPDKENRIQWRQKITQESRKRLDEYRNKMLGKSSLALVWRSELPDLVEIKPASLERLRIWALFRDPDLDHSKLVARLALQIYDGLDSSSLAPAADLPDARGMLEAAALLHDIGLSKTRKKYNVASYRMIRKLNAPMGLSKDTLRHIGLIARFHRGPLPRLEQKAFSGIPEEQKKAIILLCGILRLANAFDSLRQKQIQSLELKRMNGFLRITAPGYSKSDAPAETLAAARHLLEAATGFPILIE
jgi:CHAD domain-containing protein